MQYLGGKYRTRKQIAAYLESVREPGQVYFEPFVGATWVLQEMRGDRMASDANAHLIDMYRALQNGWLPPDTVTEEQYQLYKTLQPIGDPLTAFIGIGCSWGGKWFAGYARDPKSDRNYAMNAKNSLLKQLPLLRGVQFAYGYFEQFNPVGALVYCDPPYADTTGYNGCDKFNSAHFWVAMRYWSQRNIVIISEYAAPDDFECVLEMQTKTDLCVADGTKERRIEKLFRYKENSNG